MSSLWTATAIRVEANLSFLGMGVPPPTPTWGNMVRTGVTQLTNALGTLWFYEGQTLGFRFLHVYLPESGVVAAIGLNSSPDEDRIGDLVTAVYDTLAEHGVVAPAGAAA